MLENFNTSFTQRSEQTSVSPQSDEERFELYSSEEDEDEVSFVPVSEHWQLRNPECVAGLSYYVAGLEGAGIYSVAIIHTTQLPLLNLLFISGLGFGPRFRASGFALHLGGHLKYPMVRATRVAHLHTTGQVRFITRPKSRTMRGQVRFITRPKSRTMRATRQLMLPPNIVS
jgi:hypothetical protein